MFILNDELKDGVGILIEYYRKQKLEATKDSKWRVCNFIKGKSGRLLCTDKTYKRMSGGEHTDDDAVYDCLIRRLGFVFQGMDLSTSNKLSFIYRKLLEAVERNDNHNIDLYSVQALAILNGYEQSLFFSENIEIIKVIRKYYLESILMYEKTYLKYYEIWNAFEESLQVIIKELLYRYCHLTYHDITKLNELSERIDLKNEMDAMMRVNYIGQLMFNKNALDAYKNAESLVVYLESTENYDLLVSVYCILVSICANLQASKIDYYTQIIETTLLKYGSQISTQRKAKCYYTLGMQFYSRKIIKKGYEYLCQAIRLNQLCFQEAGIYVRHTMYFYEVEPYDLLTFDPQAYSMRFQTLYRYFDLKDDYLRSIESNMEVKEKLKILDVYILKEIVPLLNGEKILIDLFQKEVDWIAGVSFSYTNARKFRLKMEKFEEQTTL